MRCSLGLTFFAESADMSTKMLSLLGIAVVFAAVFGGFVMEHGNPWVLMQPAELLIILGASVGIVLVANPWVVIRRMVSGTIQTFRPPAHTRKSYLQNLRMLYELFVFSQRGGGFMAVENHIEKPLSSAIFQNHPQFLKDQVALDFLCDSMRMLVIGVTAPHELDHLMDLDIDIQRRAQHEPVKAMGSLADCLPGLGIVAAVLGVVITMEAIGGAPEVVGQKVAAALVGTFLGILLCYGVATPMASRLESLGETQTQFLQVLRIAIVAFARGASPILAIEYARRSIPMELRPSFLDMETIIRREARIPPTGTGEAAKGKEKGDAPVQAA
jgi:chemotaxis protein MotA